MLVPLLAQGKAMPETAQHYFNQVSRLQDQIAWLQTLVFGLCLLIAVQVLAKFILFIWVHGVMSRVEKLLGLVEAHGAVNDSIGRRVGRGLKDIGRKADQTARAVVEAAKVTSQEVRSAARVIPERTAERVQQAASESGTALGKPPGTGSGLRKTPPLPPEAPPPRPVPDSGTIDLGSKPPPGPVELPPEED